MSVLTRHALRVYVALSELGDHNENVLGALIPFFEPVLAVMNGKIFDPRLLATGVQKLYRWRINRDIAEQFIPHLVRKNYLKRREGTGKNAVYVVNFEAPNDDAQLSEISEVLKLIIDEFEKFPPRVTDLLNYRRSRDELTDILTRFLVSMDAYGEQAFTLQVARLGTDEQKIINQLEEGGRALSSDDRYMCARFVKQICTERPSFVPHLARLASIALLTEVVEDFVKPVQPTSKVDLTVVVDAPVALDYLGCSGKDLQEDVRSIVDALRGIGCNIVVFPDTCTEIQSNLASM